MPANTMQWFLGAFFSFSIVGLNLAFIQSLVVDSNQVMLLFLVIGGVIFAAGAAFWFWWLNTQRESVKREHTVMWFLALFVGAAVIAANIGYLTTKLYVLRRQQLVSFGSFGRNVRYPVEVGFGDKIGWFIVLVVIGLLLAFRQWYTKIYAKGGFNGDEDTSNAMYGAVATVIGFTLIGSNLAFVMNNLPIDLQNPVLGKFNFEGGSVFTAEFVGLGLSLILYTAAFIADIVRAGIQSVPNGQIEAARAAGLSNGQTLRMIVLPQAMRLIIPPLTNQYLNLSKNSSLAIAIGFYDLYNVGTIAGNQSGQVVVFFTFILVTYLLLSLVISLFMNFFNRSLQLKTR
jgi:ABC-type amino acid transport system permease subunit